ncbi:hypothetical protein RHMOL_Rhmol12G0069600 [Rhododendron molle]|uniref:Uncharacterized protein n=1 Tax=Rhododendron molle TaxID=49168 RepID=A0ACC0LGT3_RHOML|nr:hypothetical protein RHMOL_Rhmol12G0069600 [Rhododendron molle]
MATNRSSHKNWMTIKNRWSKQYKQGVESFIEFAMVNSGAQAKIWCPCIDCLNSKTPCSEVVRIHLILKGIFFLQTTGEASQSGCPLTDKVLSRSNLGEAKYYARGFGLA